MAKLKMLYDIRAEYCISAFEVLPEEMQQLILQFADRFNKKWVKCDWNANKFCLDLSEELPIFEVYDDYVRFEIRNNKRVGEDCVATELKFTFPSSLGLRIEITYFAEELKFIKHFYFKIREDKSLELYYTNAQVCDYDNCVRGYEIPNYAIQIINEELGWLVS